MRNKILASTVMRIFGHGKMSQRSTELYMEKILLKISREQDLVSRMSPSN
jgi:hypothetical protein